MDKEETGERWLAAVVVVVVVKATDAF